MNKRLQVRLRRYTIRFLIFSILFGPYIVSGVELARGITDGQPYHFAIAIGAALGGVWIQKKFWKWVDLED